MKLLPQRPAARFSFRGQQRIIIQWPPHLLRLRMRGGDQSWFWCFLHHINEGRSGFCHQAWNQTSTNQKLLTAIFHKHLKQNSLICLFPVLMSDGLTAGCESVMSTCFSVCRHSFSLFHGPECNVSSERSDKVKKLPEFKNLVQIFLFMWKEIKKYRTLFPFPQTNEQSVYHSHLHQGCHQSTAGHRAETKYTVCIYAAELRLHRHLMIP